MFGFLNRNRSDRGKRESPTGSPEEENRLIELFVFVCGLLELQFIVIPKGEQIVNRGVVNEEAVGYIQGFWAAAVKAAGVDPNTSKGATALHGIYTRLLGDDAKTILPILASDKGPDFARGANSGWSEYLEWAASGGQFKPTGLYMSFRSAFPEPFR
ncbi:MAG: hypothetical protein J0H14_13945 [Alphaproteobacteria bacterium]|nr:hypothetical protein [Alphaproteobacteria bacterium]